MRYWIPLIFQFNDPLNKELNLTWHHLFFVNFLWLPTMKSSVYLQTLQRCIIEFARDGNQVYQPLFNTFCLHPYSLWKLEYLPILWFPAPFTFRVSSRAGPDTVRLFPLSPPDNQWYTNQKSKLFRVARCSVSILLPGLVPATLKQHLFLPFSVWELFSLTEKTGAK